jgi:hypothetical protein
VQALAFAPPPLGSNALEPDTSALPSAVVLELEAAGEARARALPLVVATAEARCLGFDLRQPRLTGKLRRSPPLVQ